MGAVIIRPNGQRVTLVAVTDMQFGTSVPLFTNPNLTGPQSLPVSFNSEARFYCEEADIRIEISRVSDGETFRERVQVQRRDPQTVDVPRASGSDDAPTVDYVTDGVTLTSVPVPPGAPEDGITFFTRSGGAGFVNSAGEVKSIATGETRSVLDLANGDAPALPLSGTRQFSMSGHSVFIGSDGTATIISGT